MQIELKFKINCVFKQFKKKSNNDPLKEKAKRFSKNIKTLFKIYLKILFFKIFKFFIIN